MNNFFLVCCFLVSTFSLSAQYGYWQQQADYKLDIDFDVTSNQFKGKEHLTYKNNSPDTLTTVFFHLYYNAFQPESMMDVRSRTIKDPDSRVGDRIVGLNEHEIGYQKITSIKHNHQELKPNIHGTVLKLDLIDPILPNTSHEFELDFLAQVPKQIRRTGRDNKEGIRYSMTQWYPKIAEYDYMGWHAYEYIGREFHSPWGNYDVKIKIDSDYVLGGTGVIQNPNEVGHGYGTLSKKLKRKRKRKDSKTTWHFKIDNVIDFAWAADPKYVHKTKQVPNGPLVHFLYVPDEKTETNWERMIQEYTTPLFQTMSQEFGPYHYPVYSIIQGGDGGMEYPLCTLITGDRNYDSLTGVTAHELAHSWFQMMMASNEALYAWMDEGMTSFADHHVNHLIRRGHGHAHEGAYKSYVKHVERGFNEPANQHSDHFTTNYGYGISAYSKGELFLSQLNYIVGNNVFKKSMHRYYNEWKFKHPSPNDFIRILEKESGMQLQWFMRYWINTTKVIDYGIKNVEKGVTSEISLVTLYNNGQIPMPVEVTVEYKGGRPTETMYIPTSLTHQAKQISTENNLLLKPVWNWVNSTYELIILAPKDEIKTITIDANRHVADIKRENNSWKN